MKCCVVLLLMALLVNTVTSQCQCNDEGTTSTILSPSTNELNIVSIKCETAPNPALDCTWTIQGPDDTIAAVGFKNTNLDTSDTTNNVATFLNDNGDVIISATTTNIRPLKPTSDGTTLKTATVNVKINAEGQVDFEYMAAKGRDSSVACDQSTAAEEITLTEELCITSPAFPEKYSEETQCSWNVISNSDLNTIGVNVRYMDVEDACPDGDPITITLDGETGKTGCGREFEGNDNKANSSVAVQFLSDESDVAPGFLMCFKLEPVDPCTVGDPCNGGTCTASEDNSSFTCSDCPPGLVGDRCEPADPCASNPCTRKRRKTKCVPCPDVCNKTTRPCMRNCCGCRGKGRRRKGWRKCRTFICTKP